MLLESLITPLIIIFIGLAPLSLLVWAIVSIKRRNTLRRKNPINTHLLRSPGQSLLDEAENINSDLSSYLFITPFISLFFYASYLSSNKNNTLLIISCISLPIVLLFIGRKIITLFKQRENLRLGYDAELAIGQELNLLMRQGFYVFHDVNIKNTLSEFNIDHVVVGKSGVFAVETKGRSKPINSDGDHGFKVSFDGYKLMFPQWEETEPVEQTRRQSKTLEKWLTSAVGEPVTVKAVIALPGWFITTTKKTDIAVINGKNSDKFFDARKEVELTEKQVNQIAHQLESLCRNVEPKAYTKPK